MPAPSSVSTYQKFAAGSALTSPLFLVGAAAILAWLLWPKKAKAETSTTPLVDDRPSATATSSGGESASGAAYTVRAGDSLSKIAKSVYGDARWWPFLYDANKAVVGSNWNLIKVGMVLVIPPASSLPMDRKDDYFKRAANWRNVSPPPLDKTRYV